MCTSIIEIAPAEGMAKRGDTWFPLTQSVVAYDHARHAHLGEDGNLIVGAFCNARAHRVRVEDALLFHHEA